MYTLVQYIQSGEIMAVPGWKVVCFGSLYSCAMVYVSVVVVTHLVAIPAMTDRSGCLEARMHVGAQSRSTAKNDLTTRAAAAKLVALNRATIQDQLYVPFPPGSLQYSYHPNGHQSPAVGATLDSVPARYVSQINAAAKLCISALNSTSVKQFVFVTGASDTHFNESFDAVASVQRHFPNYNILYWDFGLKQVQADDVKRLCNVEYRKFDFQKYPQHIRILQHKGYKAMAQMESLANHSGIFWMDTSIRWKTRPTDIFYSLLLKTKGFMSMFRSDHSVFSTNAPGLYHFIPSNLVQLKRCRSLNSGSMFMFKTREWYDALYKWYFLCALKPECLAPTGHNLYCKWSEKDPNRDEYAQCHRYDQSIVNVLGYNHWNFSSQLNIPRGLVYTERNITAKYELKACK